MRALWVALVVVLSTGVCLLVTRQLHKVSVRSPSAPLTLGPDSDNAATWISGIAANSGEIVVPEFARVETPGIRTLFRKRSARHSTAQSKSLGDLCSPLIADDYGSNLNIFCIYYLSGSGGDRFLLNLTRFSQPGEAKEERSDEENSLFRDGVYQTQPLIQYMDSNSSALLTNWTHSKDCLFHGFVHRLDPDNRPRPSTTTAFSAVLNLCKGMYGALALEDGAYFIEPMAVSEQTSEEKRQPHLLYRYKTETFQGDEVRQEEEEDNEEAIEEEDTERREIFYPKREDVIWSQNNGTETDERTRYRRSMYSRDYFIEVMVVTDAKMMRYHGHNLENYVLTLFSTVATIYRHPSLKADVNVVVVRLVVLKSERAGPVISDNAQETLRQFCQWQHGMNDPRDGSSGHHDVAILLTREDICRAPGKCDTLGLAELGTMCDEYRSCAIIEDNGLSAAFTIAHELGHIFNIPHDDEKKCGQYMTLDKWNYHIMAPTLEYNTHPWSWSPCSAAMLLKFLDKPHRSSCLTGKPVQRRYYDRIFNVSAPGLTFDVNQQCQFVFGPNAELCPYMPACKRLWCATYSGYQVGCRTQHMPWADGTSCGNQRWCYRGECVGRAPQEFPAVDGGWGAWQEFGDCSRSCGGGVRKAFRECDNPRPQNSGRYCTGVRIRYKPCNTKDCPWDTPGFRDVQCAELNGNSVGIYGVANDVRWVPKYSGISASEQCKLYCRVEGSAAFYLLKDKVVDGTPCGRYTDDLCVDGVCRKAGCDHRLDSDMKRDRCGNCGGEGTACRQISGAYNERQSYGYNHVMRIPAGSANIDIRQHAWNDKKEDDNYLALRNSANQWVLNGDFQVSVFRQVISVKGSVLEYSGSDTPLERINSTTPIKEDIYIHVLSVGSLYPPDIRYDYVISLNPQAEQVSRDFYWALSERRTPCSALCLGTQTQPVVCVDSSDENEVDPRKCRDASNRLSSKEHSCNAHCQLKWLTELASECSVSCGQGEQHQRSFCVQEFPVEKKETRVDASHCSHMPKPPDRVACHKDCAGRSWSYTQWSECSATCAGGVTRRDAICIDNSKQRLDSRYCESLPKDSVSNQCNVLPCPNWVYGHWSPCSHTCDGGVERRHAACQDAAGRDVSKAMCNANELNDRRSCNEQPCTHWKFGPWSECSKTCGEAVAHRDAHCVNSKDGPMEESRCEIRQKIVSKPCQLSKCPEWKLGAWSQCSRTCLDGWKTRSVRCVDSAGQQLNAEFCKDEEKGEHWEPPTHAPCNFGECPFWRIQDWSPCSVSCGMGFRHREVECVYRGDVVDSSYCRDQTEPDRQMVCTLISCPEWEVGPWEPCSVTCGQGAQQRIVKCMHTEGRGPASDRECNDRTKPKVERECSRRPCPVPTTTTTTTTTTTAASTTPSTVVPVKITKEKLVSVDSAQRDASPVLWVTGAWTECSKSCESGARKRQVMCRDLYGRLLKDIYCRGITKPTQVEVCQVGLCGVWQSGDWAPCTATCGERLITQRSVICVSADAESMIDASKCEPSLKPAAEKQCDVPPCQPVRVETPVTGEARWRVERWSQCTKSCGGGVQIRDVYCADSGTGKEVPSVRCDAVNKGLDRRNCNEHRCQRVVWRTGKWSSCSKTCGRGIRKRSVECSDADTAQLLDIALCPENTKPVETHRCRMAKCPRWRKGKWSLCSVTCNQGVRRRTVGCYEGRRHKVTDTRCAGLPKPMETAQCRMKVCPAYEWRVTKWSKCSEVCKEGQQVRQVYCVNTLGQKAAPGMCNRNEKPPAVRMCISKKCPYQWVPGPWSTCSKSCDEGVQYRSHYCRLVVESSSELDNNSPLNAASPRVPASKCEGLPTPKTVGKCTLGVCSSKHKWRVGPWSHCSESCGNGYQRRRVQCLNSEEKRVHRKHCDQEHRPGRRRKCFIRNCKETDCSELKQFSNVTKDGEYEVLVSGFTVKVYCHEMHNAHPKTYIPLKAKDSNFAEIYGKRLLYPFTCPDNGNRNDQCQCSDDGNPKAGKTVFNRLRVDLHNMKIKTDDFEFSDQIFGHQVPFGVAGDCYSAVDCPQGQFSIDLRGTGFRISQSTKWTNHGHRTSQQIERKMKSSVIHGKCGGYCGHCYPDKWEGLVIEVDPDDRLRQ